MEDFLMQPKSYFAFQQIMMDDVVRKGFLSAMLRLNPNDIQRTCFFDTSLCDARDKDKNGIFDVRVFLSQDTQIDVNIQVPEREISKEALLFYVMRMYAEQGKAATRYSKLNKCMNISILDFTLLPEDLNFYSCFHFANDAYKEDKKKRVLDGIELHIIELPKVPSEVPDDDDNDKILLWAKFLNAETPQEYNRLADKEPYIHSAYEQLQSISRDEAKRAAYKARQQVIAH